MSRQERIPGTAGQLVAMRQGGVLYWLLTNHQGSVTVVANASGAQVATRVYGPWGDIYDSSGTIPTTLRYTGQREEADIGLYDYKARWYDPWMGHGSSSIRVHPAGPHRAGSQQSAGNDAPPPTRGAPIRTRHGAGRGAERALAHLGSRAVNRPALAPDRPARSRPSRP